VLPEALAACAALCDDVIPAEPEEQSPLLVVQLAGPSAVKMDDLVTGERDGIVGRHQLPASRTRRLSHFCIALATSHNSAPHPRSNNLFDQLTQDQRPRSFAAPFLTREKRASVARRPRAHECIASLKLTASADMGKARARDLDASHPAIPHSAGRGRRARGRLHAPTGHDGRACGPGARGASTPCRQCHPSAQSGRGRAGPAAVVAFTEYEPAVRLEAARAHGWEPVAGLSNPRESPSSLMEMTSDIAQEPLGSVRTLERLSRPVCDVVPLQAQIQDVKSLLHAALTKLENALRSAAIEMR